MLYEGARSDRQTFAAFRDLKDPGMLAARPQFHWTDQKLHVHVFMCVVAYVLARLLWLRARRAAGFVGSAHSLLSALTRIRCCRIGEHSGRAGRPRVRDQIEEMTPDLQRLGQAVHALPPVV